MRARWDCSAAGVVKEKENDEEGGEAVVGAVLVGIVVVGGGEFDGVEDCCCCWRREDSMEACEGSRRVVSISVKRGIAVCLVEGGAGGLAVLDDDEEEAMASHADFSSSRLRAIMSASCVPLMAKGVWRTYRLISSSSSCSVIWFFSF